MEWNWTYLCNLRDIRKVGHNCKVGRLPSVGAADIFLDDGRNHQLRYITPVVNTGMFAISTGFSRISEPSTVGAYFHSKVKFFSISSLASSAWNLVSIVRRNSQYDI